MKGELTNENNHHRIMQNERNAFVSPKDSLDTIKEILANIDLSEEQIEKILEQSKEENDNKTHLQIDYINL